MDLHLPAPPVPRVPPLWRESRIGLEAAALLGSSVWRGRDVPRGEADPVLLIPGFLAGDSSLALMTRWLRGLGYHTKRAGIRANVGCSEQACLRLEQRLEAMVQARGERASIIGQSRGGVFAKALAARRPDLVRGIVTLGSPLRAQLAVHPLVFAPLALMGALGASGRMPGVMTRQCLKGECCEPFRAALAGEFPAAVGFTSIYSRSDGIVDYRACLDAAAEEHVEVRASHIGMSVNAQAYAAIADALARFRERDAVRAGGAYARAA